jgi:hypothetical protein
MCSEVVSFLAIAEAWWGPETPESPHVMWSLSKSFTSTAVGLAVEEERMTIDDPAISPSPLDPNPAAVEALRRFIEELGRSE